MIDYHTNYVKNNIHIVDNTLALTHSNPCDDGIIDLGCSTNFLRDDSQAVDKYYSAPKITVGTPNGSTIISSCSTNLIDTPISVPEIRNVTKYIASSLVEQSVKL